MLISDQEIVNALHANDEGVFEQVFRFYYQRLCNYACNIVVDMDEAEEIVQQMFLNIWEKRVHLEINISFKSYLYRAVHNACLNRLKQQKVRKLYADEQIQITEPGYEHTSQTILKTELEKQIHNAINKLPEQCRLVFKLSRFEEMKYAEIATHLGISIKTVENHMGKALKIMREQLKEYLPLIIIVFPLLFNF
ncbi:MAG: RNA polymerase sigma-70 factor [Bacteroidia bacterium]